MRLEVQFIPLIDYSETDNCLLLCQGRLGQRVPTLAKIIIKAEPNPFILEDLERTLLK